MKSKVGAWLWFALAGTFTTLVWAAPSGVTVTVSPKSAAVVAVS